jgi:demethylmenaquinone methyltransferase/2-methoxy-6-polyprenyl-1,4-benzoquinol methylase
MEISSVPRSKATARKIYDRLSEWYDWVAGSSERRLRGIGLQLLESRPGESILEIGAGTGENAITLAQQVSSIGHVIAIDLSEKMLQRARKKAKVANLVYSISFFCADGARLPIPTAYCDAILITFTLELFDTPEIPTVLSECRRVLRAPGRICIVGLSKENPGKFAVRVYEWFHAHLPAWVDCRPIHVQQSLVSAGFQVQQAKTQMLWRLPVEIVLAGIPAMASSWISQLRTEAIQRGLLAEHCALDAATVFALVRDMPYQRASDRQPETTIREWRGTCSGKHYLLQRLFADLGLSSRLMACTAITPVAENDVPDSIRPLYLDANRRFVDIHNYLLLDIPEKPPMIVDATWPLSARQAGMVVNELFILGQDQQLAAQPVETWEVPLDRDPQDFKDELLQAHFTPAELEFRELVIAALGVRTSG